MSDTFESELTRLLNKYSIDSACNTPDFIFAEHLTQMINAQMHLDARIRAWFGDGSRGDIASGAHKVLYEDHYGIKLFADANDYGQLLRYLAGAASVCWKDIDGERVFNAEKADEICKIAEVRLKEIAREQLSRLASMPSRIPGETMVKQFGTDENISGATANVDDVPNIGDWLKKQPRGHA